MIEAQQETGLKCVSLVGTGNAGGTTGFTKPGAQDALLAEIKERVEIAKEFGTQPDLISFVGHHPTGCAMGHAAGADCRRVEARRRHRRGGGVTIAVEPLSVNPNQPRRALDRCGRSFSGHQEKSTTRTSRSAFDLYHLQRTEGNLVVNLRSGLQDKLIKLVQIGDNPGRLEPGTGEINYPFIFKELRRLNWTGYVDTEHGTSSTAEHAMDVVRKMAEEN